MVIDTTQCKTRKNWIAAQSTCPNCSKIHDIMNFATRDSFDGDCDVCGTYVCTIVYGREQQMNKKSLSPYAPQRLPKLKTKLPPAAKRLPKSPYDLNAPAGSKNDN